MEIVAIILQRPQGSINIHFSDPVWGGGELVKKIESKGKAEEKKRKIIFTFAMTMSFQ